MAAHVPEMTAPGTFEVVKQQKRLWIKCVETGELVYTPPSFIKLPSRDPMHALAAKFNDVLARDINAIVEFETRSRRH